MKIWISLTAMLLIGTTVISQGYVTVKEGTLNSSNNYANMDSYFNMQDGDVIILNEDTKGSPYLFEDYKLGALVKDGEMLVSNVALNYNAYNDEFVGKSSLTAPDSEALKVSKSGEYQIKVGNDTFVALPDVSNGYALQYYQILMVGPKYSLYKKHGKTYKEKIAATSSLTRDVPAMFKDYSTYFVADPDGKMTEVPKSKSKIVKIFPGKESEMKSAIKKNRLNTNKETDLIRLIRYYNSL
ncbi:MAG: hypothetical protein HKN48_00885 [Flavobacteriaceae bacterium]|nr:hypothetical protein [Flavobacteriaceae bacterium]